jgi:hypothetical protein
MDLDSPKTMKESQSVSKEAESTDAEELSPRKEFARNISEALLSALENKAKKEQKVSPQDIPF